MTHGKNRLDQIVRGLDGVTAWLPKRRWEQMTAAEPWLTNIVYSEDQGKFFECVPLYSAEYVSEIESRATAAEATVTALQEKLRAAEEALSVLDDNREQAGAGALVIQLTVDEMTTVRRARKALATIRRTNP